MLKTLRAAIASAVDVATEATGPSSAYDAAVQGIATAIAELDTQYADVKKRSTAHEAKLSTLADIEA